MVAIVLKIRLYASCGKHANYQQCGVLHSCPSFFLCMLSARLLLKLFAQEHFSRSASLDAAMLSCFAFFSLFLSSQSFLVGQFMSRHILNGLLPCEYTCIIGVLHSSHIFSVFIIVPSLGRGKPTRNPFL